CGVAIPKHTVRAEVTGGLLWPNARLLCVMRNENFLAIATTERAQTHIYLSPPVWFPARFKEETALFSRISS
ncbi:MAG: hypothetical protein AAFQ11_12380, partial [Pseudomonadota bacterium]